MGIARKTTRSSPRLRAEAHYIAANGGRIRNLGEKHVKSTKESQLERPRPGCIHSLPVRGEQAGRLRQEERPENAIPEVHMGCCFMPRMFDDVQPIFVAKDQGTRMTAAATRTRLRSDTTTSRPREPCRRSWQKREARHSPPWSIRQPLLQKLATLKSLWEKGILAGCQAQSSEYKVICDDGVHKTRTIRTVPKEERWNRAAIEEVRFTPWLVKERSPKDEFDRSQERRPGHQ